MFPRTKTFLLFVMLFATTFALRFGDNTSDTGFGDHDDDSHNTNHDDSINTNHDDSINTKHKPKTITKDFTKNKIKMPDIQCKIRFHDNDWYFKDNKTLSCWAKHLKDCRGENVFGFDLTDDILQVESMNCNCDVKFIDSNSNTVARFHLQAWQSKNTAHLSVKKVEFKCTDVGKQVHHR